MVFNIPSKQIKNKQYDKLIKAGTENWIEFDIFDNNCANHCRSVVLTTNPALKTCFSKNEKNVFKISARQFSEVNKLAIKNYNKIIKRGENEKKMSFK